MDPLFGFELGEDCCAAGQASASRALMPRERALAAAPGLLAKFEVKDSAVVATNLQLLKQRQMQDVGRTPGKQLMMTAFMLWMSGSGIHIFSIMMTGMALINPIKSMLSVQQAFERFTDVPGLMQAKLTFIVLNFVGLAFAVYKLHTMGLVPILSSDWITLLEVRQPEEQLGGLSAAMN